jgi:hypothetical protein
MANDDRTYQGAELIPAFAFASAALPQPLAH